MKKHKKLQKQHKERHPDDSFTLPGSIQDTQQFRVECAHNDNAGMLMFRLKKCPIFTPINLAF